MKFDPPLQSARLIQRYKRFLADVQLPDQSETTMHVANTGAMTGCAVPNDIVWFSTSNNAKRKYPCSWELTQTQHNHYICVNTLRANQLAEEAINNGVVTELSGYSLLQREVKYGDENSRIDIFLSQSNQQLPDAYVEVKSVTLLDNNQGYFPDAVTTRGQKHLRELIAMVQSGHRAVLFFAVLHSGINAVSSAKHIDPTYAALLDEAIAAGVEVIVYKADISPDEITLSSKIKRF